MDSAKLDLAVFFHRPQLEQFSQVKVSFQAAQLYHLQRYANVLWENAFPFETPPRLTDMETASGHSIDAVLAFEESTLLRDARIYDFDVDTNAPFVYVAFEFWCHPLKIAERLARERRPVMVLRHPAALELFDHLLPHVPKVLQRPGVEVSMFHPHDGTKQFDILLGGSETPDYPVRQRINRLVREKAGKYGWSVVDLTGVGLLSNPPGNQLEYSAALAAARVSPTGSNRGGASSAQLLMEYVDPSPARAQVYDDFYGLKHPEVASFAMDTAGITPRYLESMASKTLLIADLPGDESQGWYADKMVPLDMTASDTEVCELLDYWVRNDVERERLCERAYCAVQETETSDCKALELLEIVQRYV